MQLIFPEAPFNFSRVLSGFSPYCVLTADAGNDNDPNCEDQSCALEGSNENDTTSGDKKCNE